MKNDQKLNKCLGLLLVCSLNIFPQKYSIDLYTANSSKGDVILAEAGNQKITAREFLYGYEFGPSFPKKSKDSKEVYLNYLINEKLLAADGYSRKMDTLSIVKDNLYNIESDLATEELFKDEVMKDVKISDEELNNAVGKKLVTVELKWLYAPGKDSLNFYSTRIDAGYSFDSLFNMQFSDSIFEDQRKWNTDLFNLEQKSSMIASLIKNQKVGSISSPVNGPDGWYIFKIVNIWKEALPNESEINQLKEKSERALQKSKMDSLSDNYVKQIFIDQAPQIIGRTFDLLRTYLAKIEIKTDKLKEWKIDDKLDAFHQQTDSLKMNISSLVLVKTKNSSYSIKDFIDWIRYRDQFIKFNETNFNSFSGSVESYIWLMVRDNSLTKIAFSKGYQDKKNVREQLGWWKDKIVYDVVRDDILNSVKINNAKESFKFENKPLSDEANKKLLHKVLALKQKYTIRINNDLLKEIKVENENDPKSIDFYAVKKGGVFPRPAFPTIDILWQNWQ